MMSFLHEKCLCITNNLLYQHCDFGISDGNLWFVNNWLNTERLVISAGCFWKIYSFFTPLKVMQRFKINQNTPKITVGCVSQQFSLAISLLLQTEFKAGEKQQLPQTRAFHRSHVRAAAPKAAKSPKNPKSLDQSCSWAEAAPDVVETLHICSKWPKKWQGPDWGIFCQ